MDFYELWRMHIKAGGAPSLKEWNDIAKECGLDPPPEMAPHARDIPDIGATFAAFAEAAEAHFGPGAREKLDAAIAVLEGQGPAAFKKHLDDVRRLAPHAHLTEQSAAATDEEKA